MRKYNPKSREKRQEQRKNYPEFYQKHIEIIKNGNLKCEECKTRLIGDVSEIAHIMPKGSFPSVATLDENVIYLCSWKSPNNCHAKFDNFSIEKIKQMLIFPKVCRIFAQIEREIEEKINYKTYEKYSCQH